MRRDDVLEIRGLSMPQLIKKSVTDPVDFSIAIASRLL